MRTKFEWSGECWACGQMAAWNGDKRTISDCPNKCRSPNELRDGTSKWQVRRIDGWRPIISNSSGTSIHNL